MKKSGFTIAILLFANYLFAQECKVLKPEISNSYQGECKNGLAHGKGVAKGQDVYEGEFRKGYPDGEGTYTWANGSTYKGDWRKGLREGKGKYVWHTPKGDSTLVGVWKRDQYSGTGISPYIVTQQQSISRYTIRKGLSAKNKITIQFVRGGNNLNEVNNLRISSTSGHEDYNASKLEINDIVFPLDIKLDFSVPNLLKNSNYDCIFYFTINETGSWDVIINI